MATRSGGEDKETGKPRGGGAEREQAGAGLQGAQGSPRLRIGKRQCVMTDPAGRMRKGVQADTSVHDGPTPRSVHTSDSGSWRAGAESWPAPILC